MEEFGVQFELKFLNFDFFPHWIWTRQHFYKLFVHIYIYNDVFLFALFKKVFIVAEF